MSTFKTIASNSSYLTIGQLLARLFNLVWAILIARYLGNFLFGELNYGISLVTILVLVQNLGLDTLIVRELSKNLKKLDVYLTNYLLLKFFLIIISWIVTPIVLMSLKQPSSTDMLIYALLIGQTVTSLNNICFPFLGHTKT